MSSVNSLLSSNPKRFNILPIEHPDIWNLYTKQQEAFWWPQEVSSKFSNQDITDWEKLTEDERKFVKYVLAFFAGADGIVMENLSLRFSNEVQIPEARAFYTLQNAIELVHSIVYSELIQNYISDPDERDTLFNAITEISCVKSKSDWAMKWIHNERSFAERLVAFACVEGIFFSGAFCSIYWLKAKGRLPNITFSNDLIARDERLHVDFAILLYTNYCDKLSDDIVHSIILGALEPEREFVLESLPCSLIGINSTLMSQYIDYVANRLCINLGHSPLFEKTTQPFPFMDGICFGVKENFFERPVSNYQIVAESKNLDEIDFNLDF